MGSIQQAIALGWPILVVLLICSLITVAMAVQTWSALREARRRIVQFSDRGSAGRLLETTDKRLAVLGTIANAAPFIGLLGTVIGIIRGFHSISMADGGAGMGTLAGSISEALVSTGAGLAVAITASVCFNYFTFNSQLLARKLEPAVAEESNP